MDINLTPSPLVVTRSREDGWTHRVQEDFIASLIENGSVRVAANDVDRHVTSAYRLRARDPAFARAWDAARRMAYARLRDEAIERALEGTKEEVWRDGQWVGMRRVRNDRLLMQMLEHLKDENPAGVVGTVNRAEDDRSDSFGRRMEALVLPPPPPPVARPRTPRARGNRGRHRLDGQAPTLVATLPPPPQDPVDLE